MNVISEEEAAAIRAYKVYAVKHFGKDYDLSALCVPHFDHTAYDDDDVPDKLAKLEWYVKIF
jgi:hypothetical protein